MDIMCPEIEKLLSDEELKQISSGALEKIKNYLEELYEEYCKEKASASRLSDYEKQVQLLQSELEDSQIKLKNYDVNVTELRQQLDTVSQERVRLLDVANSYEKQMLSIRNEKNSIIEDRDSFMKVIERQNSELERLQQDLRLSKQQLKNAISEKCDVITRIDEIESKEMSVDFKERRMEQERVMSQNEIQKLTDDLNRTVNEMNINRKDYNMQTKHLEARLEEKIEELKIAQNQNSQYKDTIDNLTVSIQELSTKLHTQNEEANKMMNFYKKEIDAKSKLTELYKSNCDDRDIECKELNNAVADMKRMLSDATDQFGELETRYKATVLNHEQEMEEQNKIIESLKLEIKNANDLIKEVQQETVETTISKIAPSAAIASRLIRTDMSLTQLYTLYATSSHECELQKSENSRLQLQLKSILQELSENAPVFRKQEIEYEKLMETKNMLLQQRDDLINKNADMEEIIAIGNSKISFMERENKKLRHLESDLSRQVCLLLKEIELIRNGTYDENQMLNEEPTNKISIDDVISKKLVTFRNLSELQSNNEKLLLLVRDLSKKVEDAETLSHELETEAFKEKVNQYAEKIQSMQEMCNQKNTTIATVINKCERYKKMYFDLQKKLNNSIKTTDISDDDEVNDVNMIDTQKNLSPHSTTNKDISAKRIADLEQQVADCNDKYTRFKEEHEYYIKEKNNNERILNEQFDSMRSEVRELTSSNCKLLSSLEYTKEQVKLQQKNIHTYKQQITTLEDRNKNYETTIVKHEQTVQYLKDEIMKVHQNNASVEAELNHLRQENRLLKDTITRLQSEKQGYYQQQQSQNLLMNNLEIIKSNLERSEVEGRARLEQRLDETVRELSAQRRRFQEEEDRFRETTNDLKRQTETAKLRMEEEKSQTDKLRDELIRLREEFKSKTTDYDNLSKKFQESLTPSRNDNPIALANKKVRELEQQLEESQIEISALSTDMLKQREHAEQYYKMSQSAETEIKNLHELHTSFVAMAESEIKDLKTIELNLKARISELESEVKLGSLLTNTTSNESEQLSNTKKELKDCLQKLNEYSQSIRTLRSQNSELSETLSAVETKYANEMMMHSLDIQELTKLKEAFTKAQDKLNEQVTGRDAVKSSFESLKKAHDESLVMFEKEKSELENRITDINTLNSTLHDQIEALTTKLNVLTQITASNVSITESQMDISTSELDRSTIEEGKNHDNLLQIIKYLRKEKDLIDAKLDIIKTENSRLLSENTILQKKIDELQGFLNQERTKSETAHVSATKHGEVVRKIETLNALTDSNRVLREERNSLTQRVKELTDHISSIEKELFPMQNQNRDLGSKVEELSTENTSLRSEVVKWRLRANTLVEKSNKNPEEFKRLQMERESLAKMLTAEKENVKKLSDQLDTIKIENSRLESEQAALKKNFQTVNDEKKKFVDDNSSLKLNNTRIIQEVMELKNKLLNKEEIVQKLTEDLESKEALLQDSKNKEFQIRKIAKRYKDSYLELSNKTSGNVTEGGQTSNENVDLTNSSNDAVPNNSNTAEVDQYRNTIEELNTSIKTYQSENEKLKQEICELRATASAAEDGVILSKAISEELEQTKTELQEVLNARENHDVVVNNLRSQHEETLSRLSRENESLQIRINQLNRQQQTSKPSTSSVVINEKGCISESSPRTANVKPMSGSATGQQSATVQPWRGSETPLASIRPITVQNTRTAAVLPTSQQPNVGGSTTSSSSNSNTALVPPQQQVHTTGTTSAESMSTSPTSSHTDYMPSTSSTSVAVAAVPPMASTSTESSQEAESIQQQQTDAQLPMSGAQQQVVALVSPRVEGSSQCTAPSNIQTQQDPNNQQPSTSGSSGFASHIRHTPSSSNVTTSQAGCSGTHKRPRDLEDNSPSTNDDCGPDILKKHPKLMRIPLKEGDIAVTGVTDSEIEYQVPTSSQRDQEDDIVIVDSDADDGMVEADDGPAHGDAENEGYEDSYEQDADVDETEGPEVNESNVRTDMEVDNNEVDVDECNQVQCTFDLANDPSTSQAAAELIDNRQQSHTISSGSSESNAISTLTNTTPWMQASSSGSTLTRQQKATLKMLKQGAEVMPEENESKTTGNESNDDNVDVEQIFVADDGDNQTKSSNPNSFEDVNKNTDELASVCLDVDDESEEEFSEDVVAGENADNEIEHENKKIDVLEVQQSQVDATSEDNEGIDAVSSEGEKQAVEDVEEEGREAEASTSQTITTRSKSSKTAPGRRARGFHRGSARPTPIVWQEGPGNSRNPMMNQRNQEQCNLRGFPNQRTQRGRRMRRSTGGNFNNMRFS